MYFYQYSFSLHSICMFLQVFVLNSWSLFTCSKCFIQYVLKFYFKTVLILNYILLLIRLVPPLHWSLSFAHNYLTTESGTSTIPVFSIISYIVCFLNMYMWFPFCVESVTGMDIYILIWFHLWVQIHLSMDWDRSMYIKYTTTDNTEYCGNLKYFTECHISNTVKKKL